MKAAPEGVLMYQQKNQELREVCADLGLDEDQREAIFYLATEKIRKFENHEKASLQSDSARSAALKRVEAMSRNLAAEVWALEGLDRIEIGDFFEKRAP